ncbi:MAG: HRDC domain-containing protein [Planctomycetota bacterium]
MRFAFFAVPVQAPEGAAAELNEFLASHRVLQVERSFTGAGVAGVWVFCVSYTEAADRAASVRRKNKIDYREELSGPDFAVYARLRELRKELSEQEGVPPYALFTNEQLAMLVTRRVRSEAAMGSIPGIGPSRLKKYGAPFLSLLREARSDHEKRNGEDGEADPSDP